MSIVELASVKNSYHKKLLPLGSGDFIERVRDAGMFIEAAGMTPGVTVTITRTAGTGYIDDLLGKRVIPPRHVVAHFDFGKLPEDEEIKLKGRFWASVEVVCRRRWVAEHGPLKGKWI